MASLIALDPSYLGKFAVKCNIIAGVIGIQGLYDINQFAIDSSQYIGEFEFTFGRYNSDKWKAVSPQYAINNIPEGLKRIAFMMIHSPEDNLVASNQSENFATHLKRDLKMQYVVIKIDGLKGSHNGVVSNIGSKDSDCITPCIKDFLYHLKTHFTTST